MGFPTINLDVKRLNIAPGVYLVKAKIGGKIYPSLFHFGPRATFEKSASAELFIKEFIPDIKQQIIEVEIVKKIRDIIKFNSEKELVEQIGSDVRDILR